MYARIMLRSAAILLGLGATAGSLLDALHTHGGVTTYPKPVFFRMAWWTPGIFGFAGLSTGLAYPLAERFLGRSITRDLTPAEIAAGFASFTGLYAITGFLPASNVVKLAIVGAGAGALLAYMAPTKEAAVLAAATAVIGPLVEVTLVGRGAFSHNQPDFLGIPMWLPALYAAGSVAFGAVGKWLVAHVETPAEPASAKA